MKAVIVTLALLLATEGLWRHDWREILAGFATAAVWPAISSHIGVDGDEPDWRELASDTDLAESA